MDLDYRLVENHSGDIFLKVENGIATIYLNRPAKRNAITYEMWTEIPQLMEQCEMDPSIKVIIFKGINDIAFSAGADISEFRYLRNTVEGAEKYTEATIIAEKAIMDVSKPTIALIQGYCVGGGCEIAVACDFRFSDFNGKFGITPAKLGIVYSTPGTKNLVDLVGPSKTKDILYSGRLLDAEEALRIGLIDRVYSQEDVEKETYKYAKLLCKNAQLSIRGSKHVVREVLQGATIDSEETEDLIKKSYVSSDYKEGVRAFLEKRKPRFNYS